VLGDLRRQLEEAKASKDFTRSATLKELIVTTEEAAPLRAALEQALAEAEAADRFEECAELQQQIEALNADPATAVEAAKAEAAAAAAELESGLAALSSKRRKKVDAALAKIKGGATEIR
jgi:cell fate (sporulation/competence/biofilm development) regulator YlbF (YheA/YmcA/DUF963 family)